MKDLFALASFTGFSWLALSASLHAATLTQDFEIVVDRVFPGFPPSEVPPIGTRGQGRFTIDTNLIEFRPGFDPLSGYTVRQPTSFTLDFFNQRYSTLPLSSGILRNAPLFRFVRTETGGYRVGSFAFATSDPQTGIQMSAGGGTGIFTYETIANGVVSFTPAEAIPEPETIAGVPIAIALSWACHRRFRHRLRKLTKKR